MKADRATGSQRHCHWHRGIDRTADRFHMLQVMNQRHDGIHTELRIPATALHRFIDSSIDCAACVGTRDNQRIRVASSLERHPYLVQVLVNRHHALYLRAFIAVIVNALWKNLILDMNGSHTGPFQLANRAHRMSSVTPASASIDDHWNPESVRAGERQLSLFRERHQGLRDPQLHAGVISAEIGSLESAMLYEPETQRTGSTRSSPDRSSRLQ